MAIGFQLILAINIFHYMSCVISLTLGTVLLLYSSTKDMERTLRELDEMAKTGQPEAEVVAKSFEFISVHSRVKQLSRAFLENISSDLSGFEREMNTFRFNVFSIFTNDFSDFLEVTILLDFMACTIIISVVMLTIQMETVKMIWFY